MSPAPSPELVRSGSMSAGMRLASGCCLVGQRYCVEQKWPQQLWIVRHGQSAGNVARDSAEAARLPLIDIAARDIDVPLSPLGEQQSIALGQWFGRLPRCAAERRVVFALCTGALDRAAGVGAAGIAADAHILHADERLRERIRNPRSADDVRHTRATSAAERAARTLASFTFVRRAGRAGAM